MNKIENLLAEAGERTVARRIHIPHDEARMRYRLRANTVSDMDEFFNILGDYYNHHYSQCVSQGGWIEPSQARSRAKEMVDRDYRRRRKGDIVSAFNDAHDGANGGLAGVLNIIAETLKMEAAEDYLRDLFDRYVTPNSWSQKVEIISQFIARCGVALPPEVRSGPVERYAHNYEELIRTYVEVMREVSSTFRRF